MKTIILILSLMYNAFCMGQCIDKIDSVTIDSDTSHLFQYHKNGKIDTFELEKPKGGSGTITLYGNEEPVYHRKRDTVLVNCLVSKEEKDQHCGTVYAVQLYSVRELHNVNDDRKDGGWCINCPNYWEHVYFLELSKEPISENIIVWQSKEIQ